MKTFKKIFILMIFAAAGFGWYKYGPYIIDNYLVKKDVKSFQQPVISKNPAIKKDQGVELYTGTAEELIKIFRDYSLKYAIVETVCDGDTIQLRDGTKIRYLGINTPELAKDDWEYEEDGASEALILNESLVRDRRVILAIPLTDSSDHYGRLLAYVYAPRYIGKINYYLNISRYLYLKGAGSDTYGGADVTLPLKVKLSQMESIAAK